MGNCIDLMLSQPQKKIRVLILGGGEAVFKASTTVKKITSGLYHGYKLVHHAQPYLPLPPDAKLEVGEVYYLVPELRQHFSPPLYQKVVDESSRRRWKVKIVLTRQQLELMLRSGKKFQFKQKIAQSSWLKEECEKWRPLLATIPE
ncbi:uncharacterized protein LOC132278846 [Cornus florida]|uniref:uncharacterized protein LOC132278846 n=1 Tax=Cornus florida TaxID=4283 RepID=UPI00289B7339|nr:uncharacterized protein LOC132278846 [Cornus florida]